MKVLHITWNSYGREDVEKEFHRRGYEVDGYYLNRAEDVYMNQRLEQEIIAKIKNT